MANGKPLKNNSDILIWISVIILVLSALWVIWIGLSDLQKELRIGMSIFIGSIMTITGIGIQHLRKLKDEIHRSSNQIKQNENLVQSLIKSLESSNQATVIRNVKDASWWRMMNGEIMIYNALWILPKGVFRDTFQQLLTVKETKWKVVYFVGNNNDEKELAGKRKRRMTEAINGIIKENPSVSNLINVYEAVDAKLPSITFFLFFDDLGRKVSRVYIKELLDQRNDVPSIAFDIYVDTVYDTLEKEFEQQYFSGVKKIFPLD